MTRGWMLAFVSLLVFATRVAAYTPCSQSTFYFDCNSCSHTTSTDPTGMVKPIFCTVVPWQAGQPCPNGCYDLPHGRIEAHQMLQGTTTRCDNGVVARDTLRLAGPEGPDVISFEAVLLVQCKVINDGSAFAALWSPGGQYRQYSASTSEEIVFPLSLVAGTPFEVAFAVSASNASPCCVSGGLAGADITADLRFRGLPAGYAIYSCAGFTAPVPASVTSWGSVKALYR